MRLYGVDISEHNGYVDFERMKNDEVEFVMLRTSWGHFVEDKMIRRNVAECRRVGLPYGFYHYSYADSETNAKFEATSFLNLCRELGGYTYPLCLDMEDADHWKANHGVGDTLNLFTIQTFKDVIEAAGEYLTLYMSKSWFDRLRALNAYLIDSIDAWLAHWGVDKPSMTCGMWQYSSDGIVDGSSTRTDVNYCYKDYPAILASMKSGESTVVPDVTPTPSPMPSNDIKVGDTVTVKASATNYVTGQTIPGWVKKKSHTVLQVATGKVLLKEIMSWVRTADIDGQTDASTGIFLGKEVKVKASASTYATGQDIPNWVKGNTYTIMQIGDGKVLLKEIMSWIRTSDIV